ncbi:MAG: hypothetical protein P1U57_00325 [Oleibacter sp.]|nr:hypothetical protein [Thalassolituus sp.]
MRVGFLIFALAISSQSAVANVMCPIEQVQGIQVMEDGSLYWTNTSGLKRLAAVGDASEVLSSYKSLLIAAMQNGDNIQASFEDGYNCSVSNKEMKAKWINLSKGRR